MELQVDSPKVKLDVSVSVCVQPFRSAQWSMAIGQVRCRVSRHVVREMSLPVDGGCSRRSREAWRGGNLPEHLNDSLRNLQIRLRFLMFNFK